MKKRLAMSVLGLAMLLAPVTAAQASEANVTPPSASEMSPMGICGYPDNPNGTCDWWASQTACQDIASYGEGWQIMACSAGGWTPRG